MATENPLHREVSWMTFVHQYLEDDSSQENHEFRIRDQLKETLKQEALEFIRVKADSCYQFDVSVKSDLSEMSLTGISDVMNNESNDKETNPTSVSTQTG